jgi:hypothetical protein
MLKLAALALAVSACATTTATRANDVDTVLATHTAPRDLPPPIKLEPPSATVGQWALYRTTEKGEVGYQRVSITTDGCGVWFEIEWTTRAHRTISKVCYSKLPDFNTNAATWDNLVQIVVSKTDDEEPMVMDLRKEQNTRVKARLPLDDFHAYMDNGRWRHADLPREDVAVTAGHFAMAVKAVNHTHTITGWFHPGVPITGMVKTQTSEGMTVELVDYGDTGARSALPNTPRIWSAGD